MDHALLPPGLSGKFPYSPAQPNSLPNATAGSSGVPQRFLQADSAVFSSAAREALERAYTQLHSASAGALAAPREVGQTPGDSAAVILGFIESRLQALAAEGAGEERLNELLQQGLEGFRKGLEEARSILTHLNRLAEDVAAGIAETERLVLEGLGALARQFGLSSPVEPTPPEDVPSVPAVTASNPSPAAAPIASRSAYFQAAFERRESVQLELQTRDGDLITLSLDNFASSSLGIAAATASGPRGESAILAYQQTQQLQSRFSFSVEGELDGGELKALRLLLNDVSAISDEFFDGNFEEAFKLALSLNLDQENFSALSLDLSLLTRSSVIAGTRSDAVTPATAPPVEPTGQAEAERGLSQLQRLLDMLQLANRFARPGDLLAELLAARLADQQQPGTPAGTDT